MGERETEIKLRVADVSATRERLARAGAVLARERHFEDNVLFDDREGSLRSGGTVLRLRTTPHGGVLTFKGPREDHDGLKSREERESAVDNPEALRMILRGLGYRPMFRYQKYRETWRHRGQEIEVDETPIGAFIEIEGDAEGIHAVAAELGFGRADYVLESYVALFFAGGGKGDMLFPGMKAMVLAAGYGLRMRPLTLLRAKPALPVLNRPLLHWTLERLARAGVREVVVNAHHMPDTIEAAVRQARGLGLRLKMVREEPEILGTGGGPKAVREWLGERPVLLVNGDVLFDLDLRALVARHRALGARATLALRPNPGGYSPVVSQPRTGRILSIAGRPAPADGTVSMFASVHVLDPALLEQLPDGPSDSVLDLYIPMLARGEPVHGRRVAGAWYDLGRPSLYRDAQLRMLPPGRSLVDPKARVSSAALVRRSVVGARSRVASGAAVEASVLWEDAVVEAGARVSRSIVTEGAVVRSGERPGGVIVLPAATLTRADDAGGPCERHGDMAWVKVQ